MKIKKILRQNRNDFAATMVCEHCGHTMELRTGYHDWHYHNRVIPAMVCTACKRNAAGEKGRAHDINCMPYVA